MKPALGIAILACLVAAAPAAGTPPQRPAIVIRNVTLIDGTGAAARPDVTVTVVDGRISAVGTAAVAPAGATVLDGTGKWLIPGLWDMHVHLTVAGDVAAPVLLANGVTGVRDAGGDLDILDWMRARIADGLLPGPRIFRAGPFVDGSKPGVPYRLLIDTPEDGRRAVGFLKRRGVDFIKVHTAAPPAAYFALLEEAARAGLQVIGHIPLDADPAQAIAAGHGSVEHVVALFEGPVRQKVKAGKTELQAAAEFTDEEMARLGQAMAARGTWFDPTLIAYRVRTDRLNVPAEDDARYRYVSASLRAYWKTVPRLKDAPETRERLGRGWDHFIAVARAMRRERVRFLVGTDLGGVNVYPGFHVHDELRWLVEVGFTPLEVIAIATRNSAESLGRLQELGTIERGKRADLVLLEADPLRDIGNTRAIAAVIADGRLYEKPRLEALLADAAARAASR